LPFSTVPGSATVVNGVDVSGIGNGGGTAEGFVFDLKIASLIYQLWQDPVIPKVMDHSSEFYLMDSAS
jgi:guanine nucleotide-binding protein G(i) subunit alpha